MTTDRMWRRVYPPGAAERRAAAELWVTGVARALIAASIAAPAVLAIA